MIFCKWNDDSWNVDHFDVVDNNYIFICGPYSYYNLYI